MILRKPYAFLIKHFRAIHAVLAALIIYLMYETTGIYQFFNNYASSGRFDYSNNLASNYINFFMYFAVILILVITITVYLLMKSKEKKTKFYVGTVIYYIIVFIMLTVAYNILSKIQNEFIPIQTIRVYRDFTLMFYAPQVFFIIYSIIRAVGFNIKKFDFQKDLEDIEAEEKDREEVEINAPKDTYKIERKIRRFIRESIYYIKENLVIVTSITAIVIIIFATLIFFNREVYNKEYKIKQAFTYKTFNITTTASYVTNFNTKGEILLKDKYYLVLSLKTTNNQKSASLDMKHFRLLIEGKYYYPTFTKNEYFIDLGTPYAGEKISKGSTREILLIYEIPEENLNKEYRVRVADKVDFKVGAIKPTYKDIKIKPKLVNKIVDKGTYELNQEIDFKGSNVNNSKLTIKNYSLSNNYRYSYDYCYNNVCTPSYASVMAENLGTMTKTLLILDYNLDLVDSKFKENVLADRYIFTTFIKVKYIVDGKTKIVTIEDKTPITFKDKYIAQINNDIEKATSIEAILTIRNYQYTIKLR